MEIVRYEKARESLAIGLKTISERIDGLDKADPSAQPVASRMLAQVREAIAIARDRLSRELKPYKDAIEATNERWDPIIEGFEDEASRLIVFLSGTKGASWKWTVTDKDAVPDEFCQKYVDGDKVNCAIKDGVSHIKGIRVEMSDEDR